MVPNPYELYPPRWAEFLDNAHKVMRSHAFTRPTDVYRFGNRYRLANAFRGMNLEGYSAQTRAGYDALTKCSLFYSAFERFMAATNTHLHHFNADAGQCLTELREADTTLVFLRFVFSKLTKNSERAEWQRFLNGGSCSPLTLARGVRHIFLHGDLTPGAGSTEAHVAAAICDRLALAVRRPMDRVFQERVQQLIEAP
jgi:hypothetical protein